MIEAVDVHPGFYAVTGFAAERSTVGTSASHTIVELALVRILVASGAGAVFEMERKNSVGAPAGAGFVAIGAGNSDMRACQWESSGLVFCDGESSAMEIDDGVAGLATIVVGRGGELIVVSVFVAISAGREFHFINGVFARGNVALGAFHLNMFALERIA